MPAIWGSRNASNNNNNPITFSSFFRSHKSCRLVIVKVISCTLNLLAARFTIYILCGVSLSHNAVSPDFTDDNASGGQ